LKKILLLPGHLEEPPGASFYLERRVIGKDEIEIETGIDTQT
jgi:hypothetical protein